MGISLNMDLSVTSGTPTILLWTQSIAAIESDTESAKCLPRCQLVRNGTSGTSWQRDLGSTTGTIFDLSSEGFLPYTCPNLHRLFNSIQGLCPLTALCAPLWNVISLVNIRPSPAFLLAMKHAFHNKKLIVKTASPQPRLDISYYTN